MSGLVPSLSELSQSLRAESDSAAVVATFDVDSIDEARNNLRDLVLSWGRSAQDVRSVQPAGVDK